MAERKKLPGLLYDKSTGWWFSNLKDPSKKCGRTKCMWANDRYEAQRLYFEQIEDARSWPLIEMAARYYDVEKADGCSPLFLNAVRKHLQQFLDWLKSKGFDVCKNTTEDLTSALLSGYRQFLAEDASIARKTANHYIDYVRMLLRWGARVHGIHHPPLGSIQQFSSRLKAKLGHGRKQDRTPLTWYQLEKLLSAADVTDAALLMLGLNCGFGNSDIGKLKLCDVDLENATISGFEKLVRHADFVGARVRLGAVTAMSFGFLPGLCVFFFAFGHVVARVAFLAGLAQKLLHHLSRLFRGGPEQQLLEPLDRDSFLLQLLRQKDQCLHRRVKLGVFIFTQGRLGTPKDRLQFTPVQVYPLGVAWPG